MVGKARDGICVGAAPDGLAETRGVRSEKRSAVIQLGFATPHLLHAVIGIVTSCFLYRVLLLRIFCDVCRVLHEHQHGLLRVTRGKFARSLSGFQLRGAVRTNRASG